ncbi:leucine-rich repeat protein [Enterococcus sp. AZ072]|uniref:leucine-rich repeat protein n=1 Tax=unclassified Enterococcus TaxID=2608891 RepID=UPI003D266615
MPSISKESSQKTTEDKQQAFLESRKNSCFTYSEMEDGGYNGEVNDGKIPKMLGGKPVIGGNHAFGTNDLITSIGIWETACFIGKEAFMFCENLKAVTIKDEGLEEMSESVFYGCESSWQIL